MMADVLWHVSYVVWCMSYGIDNTRIDDNVYWQPYVYVPGYGLVQHEIAGKTLNNLLKSRTRKCETVYRKGKVLG